VLIEEAKELIYGIPANRVHALSTLFLHFNKAALSQPPEMVRGRCLLQACFLNDLIHVERTLPQVHHDLKALGIADGFQELTVSGG